MTISTDVPIHLFICKFSFNSYGAVLASWIMENNDVSCANNLTVNMISTDSSLM